MISENYKRKLQILAGIIKEEHLITENSVEKLGDLGFSKEVSEYLLNLNKKFSIFIGFLLVKEYAKANGIQGGNSTKNILPLIDQKDLLMFMKSKEDNINYILDWIRDSNESRVEVNIKQIDSLDDANEQANQWFSKKDATGGTGDESGKVVKVYPNKNYWIDLMTNDSPVEASAMGHCGRDTTATTLISFRDEFKNPHVTIAYNSDTQKIKQVKGKQNKRPIDEYMKYAIDFLKELAEKGFVLFHSSTPVKITGFQWSYSPHGDDLTQEDIKKIFTPEHYKQYIFNIMVENLGNTTYGKLPVSMEEAKNIIGSDLYKKYIFKLLGKVLEDPSRNKLTVSNEEIEATIGEEQYKRFIKELIGRMLEGDSVHSLGNVLKKLNDNYGISLTQENLKEYVGVEKYHEYLRILMAAAMENPVIKLEVSKEEIIRELGEEKYRSFVEAILEKITENPRNKKLGINKEEIIETVGEERYSMFVRQLINNMFSIEDQLGINSIAAMLKSNYNLEFTVDQIKTFIGSERYKNYIQRLYDTSMENPVENKLDVDANEIKKELGEDKYRDYIRKIMDLVALNPINKKMNLTKDEMINTVGQEKFNDFFKKVVNFYVDGRHASGAENLIDIMNEKFNFDTNRDEVRTMVGAKKFWTFNQDTAHRSNIR